MNAPAKRAAAAPHPQRELRQGNRPEFMTIHELVKKARRNLNDQVWDYLMGGTETETTMLRNRHALDTIAFRPRVLHDVSAIDASGTLFGHSLRIPVLFAPVGQMERFHPDGAANSGKAAGEFGIAHMLSSLTAPTLEEVAAVSGDNLRMFQLYTRGDADWIEGYIERIKDHGYSAFCLTVDSAYYSRRERVLARGHVTTFRSRVDGFVYQTRLNWDDVKRIKDTHPDLPLIIKGIATAEDTEIALEHGVAGIYVSNHGGRQLDHGRGAIDTLPEIAAVAKGKAALMIDGGFCRGSDIVKAMAMGADAVGLGKMQGLAMAADGTAGLVRLLELLEKEILTCLGLIGATSFAELDAKALLRRAPAVTSPAALGAFPLLDIEGEVTGGGYGQGY
ncbi:MAG: alpha-hydroxy acid oxidase [Rhodospirillales bacterium]